MRLTLGEFNLLPADQARQALLACCSSARWAAEVAAGRPFGTVGDVVRRSDAAAAGLAVADLQEALAGHPRIGQPPSARPGPGRRAAGPPGWSRQEQSGVDPGDQATMQALADGNQAYEHRFGHIYLVCAAGRSGAELLALLRSRLGHDQDAEWRVVRSELAKINRIRLRKLLDQGPSAHGAPGGRAR